MSAFEQIESNFTRLNDAIKAEAEQFATKVDALQKEIADLKANGTDTTKLQAIADDLAASTEAVKKIVPDEEPAPAVAEAGGESPTT